jgi:23S rRNA (cytidine1920-2'-O)/16S rRNA (cytidine1409-2'-O)-methyltransferase
VKDKENQTVNKNKSLKLRLDEYLVINKYVDSRVLAQKLILDSKVFINNIVINKPSYKVKENDTVKVELNNERYVSRGGYKLEAAIKEFNIDVKDKVCLDIGASTGGFTDCMLYHNAKLVIALDNGYNQLHPKLRNNSKVINIEKFNAKEIHTIYDKLVSYGKIDIITIDVSFISVLKIFESLNRCNLDNVKIIPLIKPNFELNKDERKYIKKGVLKDKKIIFKVVLRVLKNIRKMGFVFKGIIKSPILGTKGNQEFLALFEK